MPCQYHGAALNQYNLVTGLMVHLNFLRSVIQFLSPEQCCKKNKKLLSCASEG